MKAKRIISTLLSVLMLAGAFTVMTAAEESEAPEYTYNTSSSKPTVDYFTGQSIVEKKVDNSTSYEASGTKVIYSAEDKLATMDLRYEKDGYRLYVDAYSGEVATYCIATGEILFSNPYNVGNSTATESIKTQLMSQLVVKYVDITSGDDNTYYSYEWAAQRGQIVVRNIKNGIRVEYTIGREEARMLVPRQIEKTSFETKILNVMEAAVEGDSNGTFLYRKVMSYYSLQDPDATTSQTLKDTMYKTFPITKKMAIYTLDTSASQNEIATIEQLIKTYCPDYTYENLDEDHMLTEYESEDKNPPLFKMALEYSLDEHGMTVRLPANGIRFNESLYQLYSVEILPYMGAGAKSNSATNFSYSNSGYTFFPDGSGTLFDFERITNLGASTTVTGKVYGQDYAYHTISGTHQEILRYPVFGIVEKENVAAIAKKNTTTDEAGNVVEVENEPEYKTKGFVAIVEEGDALMEISSYHAVRTSEYNTVKMIVYPRPQDTYNVADAISVGQNDTWTVVSSRKYTGNYKVRYIMLTDKEVAEEKGIADYYECDYVGMAKAYREYLESEGVLTRLTDEDVGEDIPLYVETFGALETTERFLSIPVNVMTPLTTFGNIKTMYDELSAKGVENINFIMKGYTKGGLTDPQVPYHLKWDGAVKDDVDFEELLTYAKDNGFGIYPDFDFAYVQSNGMFDGLSLKKHAVKTIDNRYTSKREYRATKQTYVSYYEMAISPAYFSHFYEKLTGKYLKYEPIGISVSTLGSSLNSDFDEDDPYNREDSKEFTVKAFEYLSENYGKVMTSGGNAYTWSYVDYITDVALDSSRYAQSSAAVPFLGIVLHGYVEIAGTAVNMEGNIDYALLKAIENGASLKFILSYQNTNNLKNYETLSNYYSVRYDIWFDDVVTLYNEINDALNGVQTSLITRHEFKEGFRVPDDDELKNDAANTLAAAIANENAIKKAETEKEKDAYRAAREGIISNSSYISDAYDNVSGTFGSQLLTDYETKKQVLKQAITDLLVAVTAADDAKTDYENAAEADKKDKKTAYDNAVKAVEEAYTSFESANTSYRDAANTYLDEMSKLFDMYDAIVGKYKTAIQSDPTISATQKAELLAVVTDVENDPKLAALRGELDTVISDIKNDVNALTDADGKSVTDAYEAASKHYADDKKPAAPEAYDYVSNAVENESSTGYEEITAPVYASDENKIVYEEYENGTAFILNFNNYTVTVDIDGTTYKLDAYGYIILKGAN